MRAQLRTPSRRAARAGFQRVELNGLGWLVVLAPGAVAGGALAIVASASPAVVVPCMVVGATATYATARVIDSITARAGFVNVTVIDADAATETLAMAGIETAGRSGVDEDFAYVTVAERDLDEATRILHAARDT